MARCRSGLRSKVPSCPNLYGGVNPNCAKKYYPLELFEPDPRAEAVLEIYGLTLD